MGPRRRNGLGQIDPEVLKSLLKRVFPSHPTQLEQVTEGVSTLVYRIVYRGSTYYLRILPEIGASFAPEVSVHTDLYQRQVKVPQVVYFEPCYEPLQRSIMVVTEVPGLPLCRSVDLDPQAFRTILQQAGRDLARINSVGVEGFGWIQREAAHLHAEFPTYRAFALEEWEADLTYLASTTLLPQDIDRLERMLTHHDDWLNDQESRLAHGDFDTTAIYQKEGRYTGIIDFGEIRGASRWYDLGHFHLRDGEQLPVRLLPDLVRGYADLVNVSLFDWQQIYFASLLINVRALVRSLQKRPPTHSTNHQVEVLRTDLALLSS